MPKIKNNYSILKFKTFDNFFNFYFWIVILENGLFINTT